MGDRPPDKIAKAEMQADPRFHITHRRVEQFDESLRRVGMHGVRWLIELDEIHTGGYKCFQFRIDDLGQCLCDVHSILVYIARCDAACESEWAGARNFDRARSPRAYVLELSNQA